MNKKDTIIGVSLLVIAFVWMTYNSSQQAKHKNNAPSKSRRDKTAAKIAEESPETTGEITLPAGNETSLQTPSAISIAKEEEIFVLENEYTRVLFTSKGGAIKEVSLKKYTLTPDGDEPYKINEGAPFPALSIAVDLAELTEKAPTLTDFTVVKQSELGITFRGVLSNGQEVERNYQLFQRRPALPP